MSRENLREYAVRCATEPELRAVARDLGTSNIEGHMQHAASLDLAWTMDDMVAFRKEMLDPEGGESPEELSEEEMEQIAGGAVTASVVAAVAAVAAVGAAGAAATGAAVGVVAGATAGAGSSGW